MLTAPEVMKITDLPAVQMINPWSKAEPPDKCWTWKQVRAWATKNIGVISRREWLKAAREAFRDDDGETLGKMIIGS